MKKAIFLDFDGVLFDTVAEAYLVAMCTYHKKIDFNISIKTKHYRVFHMLRYLIGPAWNYYYLLQILNNNSFEDIEKNVSLFNKAVASANKKEYLDFENNFFQTRIYLRKYHYKYWIQFNKPYLFLEKIRNYLFKKPDLFFIITTKDTETVLDLLSKEKIFFNKEYIYDNIAFERFGKKSNIIQMLMVEKDIENAIFIDDSKKHLEECKIIHDLKLLQPAWGYVKTHDLTWSENEITNEIALLIG